MLREFGDTGNRDGTRICGCVQYTGVHAARISGCGARHTSKLQNIETAWAPRALQATYVEGDALRTNEAEVAPGGLSATSETRMSPSSSSSRLSTRRARAAQLPYQHVRPDALSKGKTGHFYTLDESIRLRSIKGRRPPLLDTFRFK